jgi:Zn-finger protein
MMGRRVSRTSPKPEDLKKNSRGRNYLMNYKFFVHQDCSFYPCHDLDDWKSCLFCWCPLYLVDCGGDFKARNGIKDCSNCTIPHTKEGYEYVLEVVSREVYQKK